MLLASNYTHSIFVWFSVLRTPCNFTPSSPRREKGTNPEFQRQLPLLPPWSECCGSVSGSSASPRSWGRRCRSRGGGRSGCTSRSWGPRARGPWQPPGWSWTPSGGARCHPWASGTARPCPRKAGNPHPLKSPLGFAQRHEKQIRGTTNTNIIGKSYFYLKLVIWRRLLIYQLNVITQRNNSYQTIGLLFAVGFFWTAQWNSCHSTEVGLTFIWSSNPPSSQKYL